MSNLYSSNPGGGMGSNAYNNYGANPISLKSQKQNPAKGKNKYTLAPIDHQKTLSKKGFAQVSASPAQQQIIPFINKEQQSTPLRKNLNQPYQSNPFQQNMNPQMAPFGTPVPFNSLGNNYSNNFSLGMMGAPVPFQRQDYGMPYIQSPVLYQGILGGKPAQEMRARDFEMELSGIRNVDEIIIDHTSVLAIKRGDLAIIQGEVFKCTPSAPHLRDIPLVLKRLDCVDRRIYDLKVYECDTFMRFRGHPNIISLFSYWSEKSQSPYQYKSLVCLFEEALLGDMLKTVVLNPIRPSNRLSMKYLCDISKGLASLHNCNIIHGSVKPSSLFIQSDNTAMLGELGKVELDSARHTHQLFSKVLIQDAMPHTLVYWAPEVLRLERYTTSADMWSLGVTFYQIVTGEHPFCVSNEEQFRDDLFSANVDWSRLAGYPRLKIIMENVLRVDPYKRWDANMVLAYAQEDFVIDIQRVWRGYAQRKEFKRKCKGLIMIQAHIRGFVTKKHYRLGKLNRREYAAIKIQARFRAFRQRKWFLIKKKAIMRCQANVLTRQYRRAYLKMRSDVSTAQQYIKRFLAMLWYKRIKESKENLENHIENINEMISKFNLDANQFKNQFSNKAITKPLEYLNNFEQYEIVKAKRGMIEQSHVPKLHQLNNEYERLLEENKQLQEGRGGAGGKQDNYGEDDEQLKNELGEKYNELGEMVTQLKENLKRVAQQAKQASQLPIKMQHPYQYSKWDSIHEPYNVVENVLKDDETIYKALTPSFDFTLSGGAFCFVSEAIIFPGDCGPATVEIYASNNIEKWIFVKQYNCSKSGPQKFVLPGENICKYLRIRCINNVRGGNLVNVRYIVIKGLVKNT